MISVGRLFHSLMVLGKKTWLVCSGGGYWCYKVIQMVLSSWIFCCNVRYGGIRMAEV